MAFENAETRIIECEHVEIRDPELFMRRALDALQREYFDSALCEIEKALEHGHNLCKYRAIKAFVLAKIGRHKECLDYLNKESQLLKLKDTGLLSQEDKKIVEVCLSICHTEMSNVKKDSVAEMLDNKPSEIKKPSSDQTRKEKTGTENPGQAKSKKNTSEKQKKYIMTLQEETDLSEACSEAGLSFLDYCNICNFVETREDYERALKRPDVVLYNGKHF